jgi:hypothetical protein
MAIPFPRKEVARKNFPLAFYSLVQNRSSTDIFSLLELVVQAFWGAALMFLKLPLMALIDVEVYYWPL